MQTISVEQKAKQGDVFVFNVRIKEDNSETTHCIEVLEKDYKRLSKEQEKPEELVRRSFEFLLAREPKESILKEFNLMKIGYYFNEYENEIRRARPVRKGEPR